MRLVLLGAPGSGKGTQGVVLAEHFGVPHVSSGPRTLTQARSACAVAPSDGIAVDVVVYLVMPDHVARRRVADRAAQGRVDDTDAAVIERRLLVFHRETRPLLDFYRERRLLRSVDADRPVDNVTDAIFAALADAVA